MAQFLPKLRQKIKAKVYACLISLSVLKTFTFFKILFLRNQTEGQDVKKLEQ
jgi:hypothetical protein